MRCADCNLGTATVNLLLKRERGGAAADRRSMGCSCEAGCSAFGALRQRGENYRNGAMRMGSKRSGGGGGGGGKKSSSMELVGGRRKKKEGFWV